MAPRPRPRPALRYPQLDLSREAARPIAPTFGILRQPYVPPSPATTTESDRRVDAIYGFIAFRQAFAPSANGQISVLRVSNPRNSGYLITVTRLHVRTNPSRNMQVTMFSPASDLSLDLTPLGPRPGAAGFSNIALSKDDPIVIPKALASFENDLAALPGGVAPNVNTRFGFNSMPGPVQQFACDYRLHPDRNFDLAINDGSTLTTDLYDLGVEWTEEVEYT